MSKKGTFLRIGLVVFSLMLATSLASAQLNSTAQTINLNATLGESLTVNLSASAVNFTLAAGSNTNAGSTGITATTSWVLKKSRSSVVVDAFFASAAAALTDGAGDNIPSSAFSIADSTAGSTSGALSNNTALGPAAAGLTMENIAITSANRNSSVADNMSFNIDLSGGSLPQLPAATYTGTLNIQAQAN